MLEVGIIFLDAWEWKGLIDVLEMLWHTHTHLPAHCPFQPPWRSGKQYRWPFAQNQQLFQSAVKCTHMVSSSLGCPPTTHHLFLLFSLSPLYFSSPSLSGTHTLSCTDLHTLTESGTCVVCVREIKRIPELSIQFSQISISLHQTVVF